MSTLAPPSIDAYESRSINGHRMSRIAPESCNCGRPGHLFAEFIPEGEASKPDQYGPMISGLRTYRIVHFECPSCRASREIEAQRPGMRTRTLDRGFHRSRVAEAIDRQAAKKKRAAELVAEVLGDILAADPSEWISRASIRGHAHFNAIESAYAALDPEPSGPGSLFRLGTTLVEMATPPVLHRADLVCPLLDRHASGDGGLFGKAAAKVAEPSLFYPLSASVAEANRLAIDSGDGVIRSMFEVPEPVEGHPHRVEILTFLEGRSRSTTYVLSHIG